MEWEDEGESGEWLRGVMLAVERELALEKAMIAIKGRTGEKIKGRELTMR